MDQNQNFLNKIVPETVRLPPASSHVLNIHQGMRSIDDREVVQGLIGRELAAYGREVWGVALTMVVRALRFAREEAEGAKVPATTMAMVQNLLGTDADTARLICDVLLQPLAEPPAEVTTPVNPVGQAADVQLPQGWVPMPESLTLELFEAMEVSRGDMPGGEGQFLPLRELVPAGPSALFRILQAAYGACVATAQEQYRHQVLPPKLSRCGQPGVPGNVNDTVPAVFSVPGEPVISQDVSSWMNWAPVVTLLELQFLGWRCSKPGAGARIANELSECYGHFAGLVRVKVFIQPARAMAWLKARRPDCWALLYGSSVGAPLSRVGERWTWCSDQLQVAPADRQASKQGFESAYAAALHLEQSLSRSNGLQAA